MPKSTHAAPRHPYRTSRLLLEVAWLIQLALTFALVMVLVSYDVRDPAWTYAARAEHIANWGGRAGAWVADLCFFLFGLSSYWWVLLLCRRIMVGYRHLKFKYQEPKQNPAAASLAAIATSPRDHWLADLFSFALILSASTGIEAIGIDARAPTLHQAGGVLGDTLARTVSHALGARSSTLALLFVWAIGLSLFFRFSWLNLAERVGNVIVSIGLSMKAYYLAKRRRRAPVGAAPTGAVEPQWAPPPVPLADTPLPLTQEALLSETAEDLEEPFLSPHTLAAREGEGEEASEATLDKPLLPKNRALGNHDELMGLPELTLLDPPLSEHQAISPETLEFTSRLIEKKLKDFNIEVKVVAAYSGPVVTCYEIELATGVKGNQILNLAKDLARSLSLVSIRVAETLPGKNCMGLELPNPRRQTVRLAEILSSQVYTEARDLLTVGLGKDISGGAVVADLAKMPHLLVAGTTGSGKSVAINAMILSLLYKARPDQVKMILIDPKMLEMSVYEGIAHLLCPVITDMHQANNALNWVVAEMQRRYQYMSKLGVRNLDSYNAKIEEHKPLEAASQPLSGKAAEKSSNNSPESLYPLPRIVVIIDEWADLMMVVGKKIEERIVRIAQKARAAGIHLVLATQRPSVDVITGLIKANIPTRIAFQVSSKIDSRTILDQQGAESLLGMGDMLYLSPGTGMPVRVHGAFVSDDEIHRVVAQLKLQGEAAYIQEILEEGGEGASPSEENRAE